jgi:hypothetical protein
VSSPQKRIQQMKAAERHIEIGMRDGNFRWGAAFHLRACTSVPA